MYVEVGAVAPYSTLRQSWSRNVCGVWEILLSATTSTPHASFFLLFVLSTNLYTHLLYLVIFLVFHKGLLRNECALHTWCYFNRFTSNILHQPGVLYTKNLGNEVKSMNMSKHTLEIIKQGWGGLPKISNIKKTARYYGDTMERTLCKIWTYRVGNQAKDHPSPVWFGLEALDSKFHLSAPVDSTTAPVTPCK